MIKCPNCGNPAHLEYKTFYRGETFGVHQSIQEYKCQCGYIHRTIDTYKYMGRTIEEIVERNEGVAKNENN
jgi:hypothetical protein